MCYTVGYEVEMQRVLTVEQDTFNQRHDVACTVIFGTDDCYMYHLHSKQVHTEDSTENSMLRNCVCSNTHVHTITATRRNIT